MAAAAVSHVSHVSLPAFATLPAHRVHHHRDHHHLCRATLKHPSELQLGADIPVGLQPLAVAGTELAILAADCDAVMQMYIDAGQGDRDPYWTCLWPSSIAMAEVLLRRPELVAGRRVADLGCGLGLAGLAAALCGAAEVVFLDREPLALQCALLNAQLNGISTATSASNMSPPALAELAQYLPAEQRSRAGAPPTEAALEEAGSACVATAEAFDWSEPASLAPFDVLLCCDVLYEAFSVEPVARIAPRLLRSDAARLLLADPPSRAKHNRERFVQLAAQGGGLGVEECGLVQAKVWDEGEKALRTVPITFMSLRRGCTGDTVGRKFGAEQDSLQEG